ncbi:MAG: S41 family peptidase [Thermomicrobiales bacterium]
MRATYVPMMQQAQDARDAEAYFGVLNQMASSFLDAHVTAYPATTEGMEIVQAFSLEAAKPYEGTIGAQGEAMSANPDDPAAGLGDNLTIVTVGASGPAHDAGWVPGTQVVSINGKTVKEHRETIPTWLIGSGISTQEKVQYLQTAASLLFPVGAKVTIGYIQPGETAVKTVEMVAGHYETGVPQPVVVPGGDPKPLETSTYTELDGYTVIKWADFEEDIPERIAVLEAALNYAKSQPDSKGIVIDMRGNTGGWEALYMTMESYFFSADHPMNGHVFDDWEWDGTPGGFARVFAPDMTAVSPKPDLAYTGPLAILVDQDCGSSCEFFTQSFQKQGRAIVVGQYATAGAGGNIDQVKMPMGITFQYTVGQSTWAGTDVFNIEAKGVIPDVRVPVTVEGEVARLNGTDIVLDTAIAVLEKANGGASATPAASPEASPGASPAS